MSFSIWDPKLIQCYRAIYNSLLRNENSSYIMIECLTESDRIVGEEYDICIIGSGPAGVATLVAILESSPELNVCVFESGDLNTSDTGDELREVESEGLNIKPHSRERVVGGASTTWAGLSTPLDPIDFKKRSALHDIEWPLTREELDTYYRKASEAFDFPPLTYFGDRHPKVDQEISVTTPDWNDIDEKLFLRPNELPNFKGTLLNRANADECDLYVQATASELKGIADSGEAKRVIVNDFDKRVHEFAAEYFVLACGGIENPRLLLNSTFACDRGLGNEHDQVGRYFMNHPKGNFGKIKLSESASNLPYILGAFSLDEGYSGYLGLRVSEEKQREKNILNSYIRLHPIYPWSWLTGSDDFQFQTMYDAVSRLPHLSRRSLKAMYSLYERLGTGSVKTDLFGVRNFIEMEPREDNRVTLSKNTDMFGVRKAKVNCSLSNLDKRSMIEAQTVLREEIEQSGWGEFVTQLDDNVETWPAVTDASHHMGTTRMGTDPTNSVVNKNCKLHTSPNVYIAGSSVFPTSGNANPTWTIVALALRLGEFLACENVVQGEE